MTHVRGAEPEFVAHIGWGGRHDLWMALTNETENVIVRMVVNI